ncbi:hypothetical protein RRG08_062049 [Elysia crispata]|uniref:Uncharacterized protein n=1 Tax=Elysia crispata TaxID=231223 RepID=A0AAE1A335_9GAST|nr:hypothetical protein RRG08_062049 [Elysia crispata]
MSSIVQYPKLTCSLTTLETSVTVAFQRTCRIPSDPSLEVMVTPSCYCSRRVGAFIRPFVRSFPPCPSAPHTLACLGAQQTREAGGREDGPAEVMSAAIVDSRLLHSAWHKPSATSSLARFINSIVAVAVVFLRNCFL